MVERLRALLERPLDPASARAALLLACAITAGFAAIVALGGTHHPDGPARAARVPRPAAAAAPLGPPSHGSQAGGPGLRPMRVPQDPQDRPSSAAARRARRELAGHRALQHVPYHAGGVAIDLVGALRGKAVLRVVAPTIRAARRGWRGFLRRFGDNGRAYVPRLEVGARRGR